MKKFSHNDHQIKDKIDELIANGTEFRDYFENEACSVDFLKACFHHGNENLREAVLGHIEDAVQKMDIVEQDIDFLDELIPAFTETFSLITSYNALTTVGEYERAWKCVRQVLDEFYGEPNDDLLSEPEYLGALKICADCYLEGRGTEKNVQLALDYYKMLFEKGHVSRKELEIYEVKAEMILELEKIREENDAMF